MAMVMESYSPKALAASGPILGALGGNIGGFLCTTSGTVKLDLSIDGTGTVIVAAFAVTAGVFYPMPFSVGNSAVYATLGGGAAGTFAVNPL